MKVLLINGSPHEHGCTRAALDEAARVLHECGVETELINAGCGQGGGCIACGACLDDIQQLLDDMWKLEAAKK